MPAPKPYVKAQFERSSRASSKAHLAGSFAGFRSDAAERNIGALASCIGPNTVADILARMWVRQNMVERYGVG